MDAPVTINLVVYNGEKYVRHCLDSVKKQSYENLEVNIWDNNSSDNTTNIIETEYSKFKLFKNLKNIGMWPAHEELWKKSRGKYVVVLSVDVILDPDFVKNAVSAMEHDDRIGGLQAKIFQWHHRTDGHPYFSDIIDTIGFKIFRSRRIINIGHGEKDTGQFNKEVEIFGVEGAVPIFRKAALDDCQMNGKIIDDKMFWYGDDLDLAWRMRIFGWKQVYHPGVIAYHDRSTTKSLKTSFLDFLKIRREIPILKRRLDWRNSTLAIIKNDYAINLLRDLPFIFWRQFKLWIYFLFFETSMSLEIIRIFQLLPNMLKKRGEIMRRSKVPAGEIHKWFA